MGCTIDIDTGGTFTDGFFVTDGQATTIKVPTTPHDLSICFHECIKAGAGRLGLDPTELLYRTDLVRFSNTIGTNTIIQRNGSKIGLLVTAGGEDIDMIHDASGGEPLVFPDMVLGLDEEMTDRGEVVRSPDEADILASAQKLIDRGARCLVVALANADLNPDNERLVRRVVKREYPRDYLGSVAIFLSSDITRRPGQAQRLNAAVLNAYIHATLVRLLYKADEDLRRRLFSKTLFIGHNNGNVARVAKTRALNTYNSGPAAGLLGVKLLGRIYESDDLISADMGGTSFDVGYIRAGAPSYELEPAVEGFRVNLPMLGIRAIGAGGGSIARVEGGRLFVGPQSAGSLPGPACFGLGGQEPTVADADLVLGVLDPEFFLGGGMALHLDQARRAIAARIADPLGVSTEEAALAVKAQVDRTMGQEVAGLKSEVWSEAAEPLMVAYGGAGPAHACGVAEVAGLSRIIFTRHSAVFSAFGSSSLDVGHVYYRRVDRELAAGQGLEDLAEPIEAMKAEAKKDMRGEGFGGEDIFWLVELFVRGQGGRREVRVATDPGFFDDPELIGEVVQRAGDQLAALGDQPDAGLVITTVSLVARAGITHYRIEEQPMDGPEDPGTALKGSRPAYLKSGGPAEDVPVYDLDRLVPGNVLPGPALVEGRETTALVPGGWRLGVDRYSHCLVEKVGRS
jgi:N-methylhydantoinase A/acetophenone carboxylase